MTYKEREDRLVIILQDLNKGNIGVGIAADRIDKLYTSGPAVRPEFHCKPEIAKKGRKAKSS
jgi:hypothetical protein